MRAFRNLLLTGAVFAGSIIGANLGHAQNRDVSANRLILDNGPGNFLTLQYTGTGPATYTYPPGGGSATPSGVLTGDMLRWNATLSQWEIGTVTNVGTNVTAANFVGNLNGQTSAQLHDAGLLTGSYAALNGAAITSLTGANVTGTVANATNALNFTNALSGDVTGNQTTTIVSKINGTAVAGAATANTANNLVLRDGTGNFAGNVITGANFVGNLNGETSAQLHNAGNLTGAYAALNGSAITNLTGANVTGTVPSAANFTNALAGDVTGNQGTTIVSKINGTAVAGASSANTANNLVLRDGTGNFAGNVITGANFVGNLNGETNAQLHNAGNLTGAYAALNGSAITSLTGANVTGTVASATNAANFTNALAGDVTGNQGTTIVSKINGTAVAGASSASTANNLVLRDGTGNFAGNVITGANFVGNLNGETSAQLHNAANLTGAYAALNGSAITNLNAANLTGTAAAIDGNAITNLNASNLAGAYAALNGSAITNLNAANLTGTAAAIDGNAITNLNAANLAGAYAALNGSAITNLTGANVTGTVANATDAANFTNALSGDVTGNQTTTVVSKINGTPVSGASSASFGDNLVLRDVSGNFNANDITANNFIGMLNGETSAQLHDAGSLTGNYAALDGSAITNITASNVSGEVANATNFTGNLAGDVSGPMSATQVDQVGGATAASVATAATAVGNATDAATASTLVMRDAGGAASFSNLTTDLLTGQAPNHFAERHVLTGGEIAGSTATIANTAATGAEALIATMNSTTGNYIINAFAAAGNIIVNFNAAPGAGDVVSYIMIK